MDRKRKIEVSSATLVDLKAELYKKKEQLRISKLSSEGLDRPLTKLHLKKKRTDAQIVDNLGKSNDGVATRSSKDDEVKSKLPVDDEIRNALAASKKKLEEKAILYNKLMSGAVVPVEEDFYMVDFQRKVIVEHEEKRHESPTDAAKQEDLQITEETSEDWVDYTDSLGRSRRCLKTDLPKMKSMDEDLMRDIQLKIVDDGGRDGEFIGPMPIDTEEEEPVGPIHYQNVQFNEIRTHGVGYYAFSEDEVERQKQMELLNSLRDETLKQRELRERVLTKRKEMLKARLEKVKRRQRIARGEEFSDNEQEKSDKPDDPSASQPEVVLITEEESRQIPLPDDPPQSQPEKQVKVRAWDRGKIGLPSVIQPFRKSSQKDWMEKRREERISEFAPPSAYQKGRVIPPRFEQKCDEVRSSAIDHSQVRQPVFHVDIHQPPPNYQAGRDPPPVHVNVADEFISDSTKESQSKVCDPVQEMHEFFKKTWQESLSKSQENTSNRVESDVDGQIDDIPLPTI